MRTPVILHVMKKHLLLLFLLVLSRTTFGNDLAIRLSGLTLSNPPQGYYLEDVVLSMQEDSCLGYLHPYGKNHPVLLYFKKNIRAELKDFLGRAMPFREGYRPLIIRVNRFFIYQPGKGIAERSCVDLSLSFITRDNHELTEEYTASGSQQKLQANLDVTLPQLIYDAIGSCFGDYQKMKARNSVPGIRITADQLKENPYTGRDHLYCFGKHRCRKGIYRTFVDFRNDLPDTNVSFKIFYDINTKTPALTKAILVFPQGERQEKFWGFCSGDSVYMLAGNSYMLLSREGNQFTTFRRSNEYNQEVVSSAIFGSVFFGLVGATVFGGIAAATSKANEVEKYRLDLFDGTLFPYGMGDYTYISSNVVLFLSKVSVSTASLKVFAGDQYLCDLTPGKYSVLRLSCHHAGVKLKFVSSTGTELAKVIDLDLLKTEACLLKVTKNNSIVFNTLFDQVKKDILEQRTAENTTCTTEFFERR
jgi:hypothetical protein